MDKKFDTVLDANDPDFRRKLRESLGIKDTDLVQVLTPQFERTDGVLPALPDCLANIATFSKDVLEAIGCRSWGAPDSEGKVLMLFPYQWYAHIPAGMQLEDIAGSHFSFEPNVTDDDYRFGMLAYGVRVAPF